MCATGVASYVIWVVVSTSLDNPTGITQVPEGSPLSEIPFPSVAICPLNLLSKRRVMEYAKNISKLNEFYAENATIDKELRISNLLGYLGLTYDNIEPPNDELEELHSILQTYDLRRLIENLAPQCNDIMVRCLWRGKLMDCRKIFHQNKTSSGFCCIFNYQGPRDGVEKTKLNKSLRVMSTYGLDRGLSVVVNPEIEDYYYTSMPNAGFRVMVFHPTDYPDLSAGGILDMYVAPTDEQFFSMSATVLNASQNLLATDIKTRQCATESDSTIPYESNSECYVTCKILNIHATCGCVPFYLPLQKYDVCDLLDEECLRRWKNAWSNSWLSSDVDEEDDNGVPLDSNVEPPCTCFPACSNIKYSADKYSITLQPDALNSKNDSDKLPLKRGVVFTNHSVIHVFFAKDYFALLYNDVLFSWYDWLSSLGGLCGLVLGCSVLSVAEIIYYFVFGGPVKEIDPREQPARQLYWQELRRK